MDLRAIKSASRADLSACAVAAARNGLGLLHDAEVLARSGSTARAFSVAAFAVEECGKAMCLCALAALPRNLRAQAPVGRMLEWHQLKQVGGLLAAVVTVESPGAAARLAAMPAAEATQIVRSLAVPADEADRLKRRGLYVDMDRRGRIRKPSEITDAEVSCELDRARQAAHSARQLLSPEVQARLARPPAEVTKLARALVSACIKAGHGRTPDAAVGVMLTAVASLHDEAAEQRQPRIRTQADSRRLTPSGRTGRRRLRCRMLR